MRDLPENIDAIPWSKLQDAYGPSKKTPGYLKRLMSTSADERQDAFDELTYTIYHQGSVYEASLYAIAPLAGMLKRKELPDPAMILELLYLLGRGSGWHTAHQHTALYQKAFASAQRDLEVEKESEIGLEIHEALSRYLDVYCAMLRAPGESTRLRAGNLLMVFREKADALLGSLQEVLDHDESMRVRSNVLMVLDWFLSENVVPLAQKVFRSTTDPLLKTAAATRWARWKSAGAPKEALNWLVEIVETRAVWISGEYDTLPSAPDFWLDAANPFALGGAGPSLRVLPRYIDMLGRNRFSEERAIGLLLVALCHEARDFDVTKVALSPEQKKAILAVAQCVWPKPNDTYANMSDVLRRFGLPDRHEGIDRLLGLPNADHPGFAGPRDKAVADYQAQMNKPWWKFW